MKTKIQNWLAQRKNKRFLAVDGAIALALVALIVVKFFFWFPTVRGSSMEPTFSNGNVISVSLRAKPQEGDVCMFWSNALGEYVVKRVVAIGPCDVTVSDAGIFKNGELIAEDYVKDAGWAARESERTYHLSENQYFALGDNRLHSTDSRTFGPMTEEEFVGVVVRRIL